MAKRKAALHAAAPGEERTFCGRELADAKVIINGLPTCSVCLKIVRIVTRPVEVAA